LAVPDNLRLMVFLYGFGALVGLVRVTGGVAGFAQWMGQRVQSWRQAMAVTWLSALVTCMAPDFRIITTGPVARTLFQRLHAPLAPAALAIDITATPLCAVIPVGTAFVGYMISLLSTSARHHGSAGTPFAVLLLSIPLNFFAWGMLVYGLWDSFLRAPDAHRVSARADVNPLPEGRAQQRPPVLSADARLRLSAPLARAEWAAEWAGPAPAANRAGGPPVSWTEPDPPDPLEAVAERVPPRLSNLALPLVSLLVLTLLFTWLDGRAHGARGWNVWAQANAAKAMLDALVVTLLLSLVWYAWQRVPAQRLVFGVVAGGNEMMSVIVLLALVWAVSAVSSDLGFAQFVGRAVSRWVPPALLVPALFVFGCAISYVIGSSFGTWGL
ncbi:MAG: sodium:proton antiporter, partial [Alicyclobacillus sp.]|nr:sodium:proton antiporter [Alicyclobacillus sp.]